MCGEDGLYRPGKGNVRAGFHRARKRARGPVSGAPPASVTNPQEREAAEAVARQAGVAFDGIWLEAPTQTLRHVLLPQALRLALPPMTNDFVSLLKDSSLVSVITVIELTKLFHEVFTRGKAAASQPDEFTSGTFRPVIGDDKVDPEQVSLEDGFTRDVRKIGHFGTLDPFAEGVLMIGTGGAARLNDFIHEYLETELLVHQKQQTAAQNEHQFFQ